MASTDILLHPAEGSVGQVSRAKLAAFVPITIALAGVLFILAGGVSSGPSSVAASVEVDPVITGSVWVADPAAIRTLDD